MDEKLFHAALDAGLNTDYAMAVACGYMSLSEALGDMDMNEESLPFTDDLDDVIDTDSFDDGDFIPW
ncbi:hypothetical protein RCIP0073_00049 [Klebsiella phage RCIP0073]